MTHINPLPASEVDFRAWRAALRSVRSRIEAKPAKVAGVLTLLATGLFMAFPGLDLAASHGFARGNGGFPLSREPLLVALRDLNRALPFLVLPGVMALLLLQAIAPQRWLRRPHKAIFFLAFYALGPGLLIQSLKGLVGRARPHEILEFGGSLPFTPAWQVSAACARNCSFASGEASSAIALLALALLLPSRWQKAAIIALVPVVLAFSVNRIAFGAHFLSDVVIAWALMLWLMAWLWPVFSKNGERIDRRFWRGVGYNPVRRR